MSDKVRVSAEPQDVERERVYCDDGCGAFDEPSPESLEELRDAYDHWRKHEHLNGCSHGC